MLVFVTEFLPKNVLDQVLEICYDAINTIVTLYCLMVLNDIDKAAENSTLIAVVLIA